MNLNRRVKRVGVAAGLALGTLGLLTAGLPYGPLDFLQIAAGATYTTTSTSSGGGGGGTSTTSTDTTTTNTPSGDLTASQLTGTAPTNVTATVNTSTGGTIIAGNTGLSVPPGFVGVASVTITISTTLPTTANIPGLAGNVIASPNGTVFDLVVTDATTGAQITSFNAPITFTAVPNGADIAISGGHPEILTVVYFIVGNTISVFNPLGLPPGTPLFQPNVRHHADGSLSWDNQNGAGVVQAVVANPLSYVQTLNPNATEQSGYDSNSAQTFGTKPQFSYLQVVEPQIPGVNRLVVLDPDTGNYSYVNATDVGPSGPPPSKTSAGVTRGLLGGGSSQGQGGGVIHNLFQSLSVGGSGVVHGLLQ